MDQSCCIRIWTRHTVPQRFLHHILSADEGPCESAKFLAHVPEGMLGDVVYQECNGDSGFDGWMREGELGFFKINAMNTVRHPDGDGVLIVGSWI